MDKMDKDEHISKWSTGQQIQQNAVDIKFYFILFLSNSRPSKMVQQDSNYKQKLNLQLK